MSDEARRIWQAPDEGSHGDVTGDVVLSRVRRRAAELDRTLRRRDRLESVAAVVLCALFVPLLFGASWVTRAGVVLFLLGSALILVKLRRARREPPDPAAPLGEVLRAERERLHAQIRLLDSVLWWYIAPLGLGVILVFVGSAGLSWASLVYTAVVVALGAWIRALNRDAARRELAPRRDALDRLLVELEGDAS